ncbi:MAG TPA: enoyl-CoA hydratase/isomerase family protein, partial [Clostridia bacterium]|nr:enoyl-CoA hydratase/isomerase family protein [Clostridia bacterium]
EMKETTVLIGKQDRVCTLTINRPYIKNAWTVEFVEELRDAFRAVGRDKDIHVVVLEGAGRDFSSGADYALFKAELSPSVWLDGMRTLKDLIVTIRGIPQPVVAKVHVAVPRNSQVVLTVRTQLVPKSEAFEQSARISILCKLDNVGKNENEHPEQHQKQHQLEKRVQVCRSAAALAFHRTGRQPGCAAPGGHPLRDEPDAHPGKEKRAGRRSEDCERVAGSRNQHPARKNRE